jgi:hypothetical protein
MATIKNVDMGLRKVDVNYRITEDQDIILDNIYYKDIDVLPLFAGGIEEESLIIYIAQCVGLGE